MARSFIRQWQRSSAKLLSWCGIYLRYSVPLPWCTKVAYRVRYAVSVLVRKVSLTLAACSPCSAVSHWTVKETQKRKWRKMLQTSSTQMPNFENLKAANLSDEPLGVCQKGIDLAQKENAVRPSCTVGAMPPPRGKRPPRAFGGSPYMVTENPHWMKFPQWMKPIPPLWCTQRAHERRLRCLQHHLVVCPTGAIPENREIQKKRNSVFFCHRHALSPSFDIFVVTVEWLTFCQNSSTCYYFLQNKLNFHFLNSPILGYDPLQDIAQWGKDEDNFNDTRN